MSLFRLTANALIDFVACLRKSVIGTSVITDRRPSVKSHAYYAQNRKRPKHAWNEPA